MSKKKNKSKSLEKPKGEKVSVSEYLQRTKGESIARGMKARKDRESK